MPELPEVEAVCGALRRALRGRAIASLKILRARLCAPQDPRAVERAVRGRRFLWAARRGKWLEIRLEGVTLSIHLRLTGHLRPSPRVPAPHPAVAAYFRLDNARALIFDDRRGLGVLRLGPAPRTGIDPLRPDFTPQRFAALAARARGAVKTWLLDPRRIAGLGNIYAAEALFRAGIDPRRPGASLSGARLERLRRAIVAVLRDAVQSASLAYQRPGRFADGESFDPAVYGREGLPCRRCGGVVRRIVQGGRSTYFCPRCQR